MAYVGIIFHLLYGLSPGDTGERRLKTRVKITGENSRYLSKRPAGSMPCGTATALPQIANGKKHPSRTPKNRKEKSPAAQESNRESFYAQAEGDLVAVSLYPRNKT